MANATLFDPPAVHRGDPITSYKASDKAQKKVRGRRLVVLNAVKRHPGRTRAELADIIDKPWATYIEVVRRVSDLKNSGHVRDGQERWCAVRRTECTTVWPRESED